MTPCVVFQVSQPYSSTDLTFEPLLILILKLEHTEARLQDRPLGQNLNKLYLSVQLKCFI